MPVSDASKLMVAACSDCGKQYKLDPRMAGRSVKCKACGNVFRVAAPAGGMTRAAAPNASVRSAPARSEAARSVSNPAAPSAAAPPSQPARSTGWPPAVTPPPPPPPAEPELPSLHALAELETTGTPNQFSNVAPVSYGPAGDPWHVPKKKPLTIHDADPKVAKAYEKKMSRRAMIAGGSGLGGIGVVLLVIRVVARSAQKLNRDQQDDSSTADGAGQNYMSNAAAPVRDRQAQWDQTIDQNLAQQQHHRDAWQAADDQAADDRAAADRQAALAEQNRQQEEFRQQRLQRQAADEQNRQAQTDAQMARIKANSDRMAAESRQRMEDMKRRQEEMLRRR